MAKTRVLLLLLVVILGYAAAPMAGAVYEGGGAEEEEKEEKLFLLRNMKAVVETEAGRMDVVEGFTGRHGGRALHIGFITMEPKALFIPQYLDSNMILFVRRGEARVGSIYNDRLVEKRLKMGDVYRIGAGSAFYLVNTGEGQILHIVCSIDKTEDSGWGTFHSFFIGGGAYSVLAGFDPITLSTALNVSVKVVKMITTDQELDPIVFYQDAHSRATWTQFLELKEEERFEHLKRKVRFQEPAAGGNDEEPTWSLRKLLNSLFGKEANRKHHDWKIKSPEPYNLYHRKPDFKNNYGWSIALDDSDYWPLGLSDVGVFLVYLTAGSMMAPHINPMAPEIAIVLRGEGEIQVVFPNGTLAMKAKVGPGDVFWIPQFFPFCQIASRTGPFEFFGVTTSSSYNRPQFLLGAGSILRTMMGPELAAGFGMRDVDWFSKIVRAQEQRMIFSSASAAPPDMEEEGENGSRMAKVLKSFGDEMVMGFD
ncbi:vicilin-like seed storage protein At2g28490 [Diospyros lotus]|uniref:vicilin-like seed storage protein At2g28490 n=1 Tax=Diospyros lotus TaxID=55363 RepID=UPI002257C2D0|nr:vicilin-like seed storage protein At2g28490 [Diospyros lotus]